jgi:hypothetical protein
MPRTGQRDTHTDACLEPAAVTVVVNTYTDVSDGRLTFAIETRKGEWELSEERHVVGYRELYVDEIRNAEESDVVGVFKNRLVQFKSYIP